MTDRLLERLDDEASTCDSFVTLRLTAVLFPQDGVSLEDLRKQVECSSVGGVFWEQVVDDGTKVDVRAGLVPSMTGQALRSHLLCVPGVARASVEGVDA